MNGLDQGRVFLFCFLECAMLVLGVFVYVVGCHKVSGNPPSPSASPEKLLRREAFS